MIKETAKDLVNQPSLDVSGSSMRGGWMLKGLLTANPSLAQCRLALRMSYQSLSWVRAGLAMASETDELLLMQWHSRLPSPGSMPDQLEAFRHGLGLWRSAFESADHRGGRASIEKNSEHGSREYRMRQLILRGGHKDARSFRAAS